jgi:hypothetical protein
LVYVPFTSASPSGGGLLRRRRGARRVHADVTVRDARAQHGEVRHFPDDHDDGDAPWFRDARQFDDAQPWRDRAEHWWCADHWNRYRREGEDTPLSG